MPSFATALSGLESNNTALNTIANNLANMNTVGYKDQTDQFSTLFYQQLNSGVNGGVQVGVGTQVARRRQIFRMAALRQPPNRRIWLCRATDFSSSTTTASRSLLVPETLC